MKNSMMPSGAVLWVVVAVALSFALPQEVLAAKKRVPAAGGAVALVNGEAISRGEYEAQIASMRSEKDSRAGEEAGGREVVLRRLIDVKLVAQEARRMGLDQLPEIKNMVDVFSKITLREQLMDRQLKGKQAEEAEVNRLYRAAVAEWKMTSLLFSKQDDADRMVESLKGGRTFDELAKEAIAADRAKAGEVGEYLKAKEVNKEIAGKVSAMKPGEVSPAIRVKAGYVVLRLDDVRYPDDAKEKETARGEVLKQKRLKVLKDYNQELTEKYTVLQKDIFAALDFEAKEPGFDKLFGDNRVLVQIKDESPITVAEYTRQIRQQLYHGVERAAESKNINVKKQIVLDDMIYKRVFRKEAVRLKLDKSPEYRRKVKEYEDSAIFGAFVQKAIAPDVRISEEEAKAYYEGHIADYTSPEMIRLGGLAFTKRADAENAVGRLKGGTDLQWLRANAEGQADSDNPDLLPLDGKFLTVPDLPEGLRKAISGSNSGDIRLFVAPEGIYYALMVENVVRATPRPYDEARNEIGQKIFDEKLKKGLDEYLVKLRAAANIKVYGKEGRR